ncbi:hypothetical protein SAMN05444678_12613 [Sphingomonas sp. YR710]|uniref:hypothetical protein n=1 Tax=Sphingomonas sp. YR710 TaxID=1882773 RepID=UPI000887ED30|nr:hypothetical protein [Sphingomonas sp. YR710]SDD84966.1 hypothetical protein SAMN05444678_12613 [Sphingomonas sp. YR710]
MSFRITLSPLAQVKRSAQALKSGEAILAEVLSLEEVIVEAAERGVPPVGDISAKLSSKFPTEMKAAPVRQFVGTAVKAVLAKRGFEVLQSGIRLPRDPVFRSGSIYRKTAPIINKGKDAVREVFSNMVGGMSLAEKRILLAVVQSALGQV